MSDDQENVDGITGSLTRSQTAKELEIQLLQLRKGALLQHKKKAERRTSRTLSRMELELPTIQPSSAHVLTKHEACVSKCAKNQRQESGPASTKLQSIALRGNNFKSTTKSLSTNTPKLTEGTGKREVNCFRNLENTGILPGFCGPCFRPWSRGKNDKKRKRFIQGDYNQQEANFQRFYSKHQRSRSDCFNLSNVLSEVTEISRFNENHAKRELVPITTSSDILMPEPIRGNGLLQQECLPNDSETTWTVAKKVIPVKKEQRLKKLLRRQLISCYDLGPVIEPFDVIVGETLSHKNPQCEVKHMPDFPRDKQEIFPFAVPYLRLPLLPSSRNELVKISHVLTQCEVFPWQLQNIKLKYKRGRAELKTAISPQGKSPEDSGKIKSSTKERDKAALQIFVPASN